MPTRSLYHELIAEMAGTFILLLFGQASVAMVVLFSTGVPGEVVNGGYTNIVLGWGLGVTFGIYTAGKITGAHLNPAVTLTMACFRGFPWSKVLPYSLAQTVGAFLASAIVYWNYLPAFRAFDPLREKTAGVFCTFPAFPEILSAGFLDQVVGTAALLFLVLALSDERNQPPAILTPILVGLVVVAIGIGFGKMHGYAINPARDFGPRLFVMLAGFRNNGLTDGSLVFLVPIFGPLLGGVIGGFLYDQTIGRGLKATQTHTEA